MSDAVTPQRFHALEGVDDWRMVGQTVCTTFRTGTWACRPTRPPYRVSWCASTSAPGLRPPHPSDLLRVGRSRHVSRLTAHPRRGVGTR